MKHTKQTFLWYIIPKYSLQIVILLLTIIHTVNKKFENESTRSYKQLIIY